MIEVPGVSIELAKRFEGLFLKPYICPGGFWTIGYGHLCKKEHPFITEGKAEEYLRDDLRVAFKAVGNICPILLCEDENKLGAIVDFTFNLGSGRLKSSTLKKRINDYRFDEVPGELMKWVYGGGRKLNGLIRRRTAEAMRFAQIND